MLPHQRNKVDVNALSEEEQKLFRLYGKLPTKKKTALDGAIRDRKFFDSGDYALAKAGKASHKTLGTTVPSPENIPHSSPASTPVALPSSPTGTTAAASPIPMMSLGSTIDRAALASSPVKESKLSSQLQDEVDAPASKGGVSVGETGSIGRAQEQATNSS